MASAKVELICKEAEERLERFYDAPTCEWPGCMSTEGITTYAGNSRKMCPYHRRRTMNSGHRHYSGKGVCRGSDKICN